MKKIAFLLILAFIGQAAFVFQSCSKDEEKANQPPTCVITSPANGQQIQAGEVVTITVDAKDGDGSINEVRFFINNIGKRAVSSAPYSYTWDTGGELAGNYTLKATSIDNTGESKSDEISIGLGFPPTAIFTVSPTNGTTSTDFAFDAGGSTDNETPTSQLQVRWDFDGNGSWDTNWDTDKTKNHQYSSEATYTAKLEVKDAEGFTDQYTKSITVVATETFTDPRDGRSYATIKIGSQTWFAENLNYQTYNSWWYDNSSANGDIYGRLYTWDAALNACPSGWHLPSDDEWKTLEMALGMSQSEADVTGWRGTDEGGKMKAAGTAHWDSPNTGATNISGFTALPGGERDSFGRFNYLGISGGWWSATEYSGTKAWFRTVYYGYGQVARLNDYKTSGLSVRCIKD